MIKSIFLIFVAVIYMVLRLYFKKRIAQTRVLSDEERLTDLTQAHGVSAYKIFHIAGKSWNQMKSKIEADFKFYLQHGDLPHYVRDYVRKNDASQDQDRDSRLNSGGNLPPSWPT